MVIKSYQNLWLTEAPVSNPDMKILSFNVQTDRNKQELVMAFEPLATWIMTELSNPVDRFMTAELKGLYVQGLKGSHFECHSIYIHWTYRVKGVMIQCEPISNGNWQLTLDPDSCNRGCTKHTISKHHPATELTPGTRIDFVESFYQYIEATDTGAIRSEYSTPVSLPSAPLSLLLQAKIA